MVEFQRGLLQKSKGKNYSSCFLHVVWWCFKFLWNFMKISWTNIGVIERTTNYHVQFQNSRTIYRQELQFVCSARRLMMLYISIKFHENILNGFQVKEWTRIYHCRISKGNYSNNVYTKVTVGIFCMSSDDSLCFCEVSWKYLKRSSYWAYTIADRLKTETKTVCLYPCQGKT